MSDWGHDSEWNKSIQRRQVEENRRRSEESFGKAFNAAYLDASRVSSNVPVGSPAGARTSSDAPSDILPLIASFLRGIRFLLTCAPAALGWLPLFFLPRWLPRFSTSRLSAGATYQAMSRGILGYFVTIFAYLFLLFFVGPTEKRIRLVVGAGDAWRQVQGDPLLIGLFVLMHLLGVLVCTLSIRRSLRKGGNTEELAPGGAALAVTVASIATSLSLAIAVLLAARAIA